MRIWHHVPAPTGFRVRTTRIRPTVALPTNATRREMPVVGPPHAIRRGSITHWLREDVPTPAVSDRADVSADVIDQHYDERTDQEKMEQRRQYLDNI